MSEPLVVPHPKPVMPKLRSAQDRLAFRLWVDPAFRVAWGRWMGVVHGREIAAWMAGIERAQAAQAQAVARAHASTASGDSHVSLVSSYSPPPMGSYNATGSVNGYPCGGSLPSCCTLSHESGGNPLAQNPSSTASGLWQFLDTTWAGYGGYAKARYAPASVQNARAAQVFAGGAGASNWYGDGCYNGR